MPATTAASPQPSAPYVPVLNLGGDKPAKSMLSPAIGAFAMELACDVEPLADVKARYGVTDQDFKLLLQNRTFRDAVKEYAAEFKSLANTSTRVRVKAQLLVEMGLQKIWGILSNPAHGATAQVAAFGQLKSLTGLEKPEIAPPREKFSLTINLGPDTDNPRGKLFHVEGPIIEADQTAPEAA